LCIEDFKRDNVEQDLTRLVGENKLTQNLNLLEQRAAMEAVACVISYLEVTRLCKRGNNV
jgi:hypothetical protein